MAATVGPWAAVARVHEADGPGHGGNAPVVDAALEVVGRHLGHPTDSLCVEWSSDIPRSVGLAGSSALVVGVIEAVAAHHGRRLDPRVVAALALAAEVDVLGIPAGWQDRVAQAHRGLVLVDAEALAAVDGLDAPTVRPLTASLRAVVGWRADLAEDSGVYHGDLRADAPAARDWTALADLARAAAAALDGGDDAAFRRAVDAGWRERQRIAPLRADHAELVDGVRAAGVVATTPGSGGSVVALPADDDEERRVIDVLTAAGARHVVTVVGTPTVGR